MSREISEVQREFIIKQLRDTVIEMRNIKIDSITESTLENWIDKIKEAIRVVI